MIYVDTSALVKLVVDEEHSHSMIDLARHRMAVSEIGATELRRAVRRRLPDRMVEVERVLSEMTMVTVSRSVLRSASALQPATLRTLDAIHLASAIVLSDELEAFVSYDERLLEAAHLAGIPTASPGL